MAWLSPAAFLGLVAVAGPILVHLLRRRHARRLTVPSVRFVAGADESSAHLRRLADRRLLLVRVAIVVAAVLALARPLLLTGGRAARWAERVSRAVVVDTSESVRGTITSEAIAAASVGAGPVTTVEARDIAAGLKQAVAWLSHAPPSRREIVVLSDFQRGALAETDLAAVPPELGVRLVRAALPFAPEDPVRLRVLSHDAVCAGRVDLDAESTAASWTCETDGPFEPAEASPRSAQASWEGLQILADPSASEAAASLRRVLSRAGVHAPAAEAPIVVRFGRAVGPPARPVVDEWTFGAAQRFLQATRGIDVPVDVTSSNGSLLIHVESHPGSLAAAQLTAAALNTRIEPATLAEREIATIPDALLAAWSREPAPPDPADWTRTDDSDGRVFWGLALLLLGVESRIRAGSPTAVERAERHAA